ncbi:restriction endonuclease subunit S [Kitasatospora sp. NPDC049285]|uniref:restriction endonuclease subunit S n=1 Tax=Kitasatospora sp. NPDC049285 TaxID=3157096 RepID=UPI003438BDDB
MSTPQSVRLEDCCSLQAGPSAPSPRALATDGSGVPMLRPQNIGERTLINDPLVGVPDATAKALDRYRLRAGDVLCVRTGRPGKSAAVTERQTGWLYSGSLFRIRPGAAVDPSYLVHYLASPAVDRWLHQYIRRGAGIPSLTLRDLSGLPIPLPSLDEQREAVRVLVAIDEKIAVHRRIAETAVELRAVLAARLFAEPGR